MCLTTDVGLPQDGMGEPNMQRPDIQRWVGNSQECVAALDAADRRDADSAVDSLHDASQHNFVDYPERRRAFEEAKAYVEATLGIRYREES